MSNRWVINWLVTDHYWYPTSNRRLVEDKKFCGLLITHQCHRLLVNVIEWSSMLLITHFLCCLWPTDYSLVNHFFSIQHNYRLWISRPLVTIPFRSTVLLSEITGLQIIFFLEGAYVRPSLQFSRTEQKCGQKFYYYYF